MGSILDAYTKEQIIQLNLGYTKGLNFKLYAKPALSARQMRLTREALEKGWDATYYAHRVYNRQTLAQIDAAIAKDIDLGPWLKRGLSAKRLEQVRLGLEQGLDVSLYDKESSIEGMIRKRKLMSMGMKGTSYLDKGFSLEQLQVLRKAIGAKVNVNKVAKLEYSAAEMRCITEALKRHLSIKPYTIPGKFTDQQYDALRMCMKKGLDASILAIPRLSPSTILWLADELLQWHDISIYLKEHVTADEILEARTVSRDVGTSLSEKLQVAGFSSVKKLESF